MINYFLFLILLYFVYLNYSDLFKFILINCCSFLISYKSFLRKTKIIYNIYVTNINFQINNFLYNVKHFFFIIYEFILFLFLHFSLALSGIAAIILLMFNSYIMKNGLDWMWCFPILILLMYGLIESVLNKEHQDKIDEEFHYS